MTDQGRSSAPAPSAPGTPTFSGSRLLVASCAVVATGAYLGASWLRAPVFGIPTGLWLVAITQGAAAAWNHRARRTPAHRAPDLASFDIGLAAGRVAALAVESCSSLAESLQVGPGRRGELEQSLCDRLDRAGGPSRPLRIGLDVGPDLARLLAAAPTPVSVEWIPVPAGTDDPADLRGHTLDALIRHRPQTPLRIITPEHDGRDAAWYDWATPRPLTYASLFPTRLDPARITLDDPDHPDAPELHLVAALAVAAASFARSPCRLSLSDRLRGRRPEPSTPTTTSPTESCLRHITALLTQRRSAHPTLAQRAAARLISGWLSAADAHLDAAFRRQGAEAALQILGDEPEALLRAATVRFAACDDRAALDALARADQIIRRDRPDTAVDHLPFLEAEVQLGLPGPMTLGRVAAGIALVCATSPASRLDYIRTDVMDDARYSAWLVGRDQDRAALAEVFRLLSEARRAPAQARRAA